MNKTERAVFRFLKAECPDLGSAKLFVRAWARGTHRLSVDRQEIPIPDGPLFEPTMRACAAIVSQVLESDEIEVDGFTDYLSTKYGSELYFEM